MSKKLILSIISILMMFESNSQNNDSLFQFASANENLFWSIVSRNYPFTEEEIIRYKEDINFRQLSGNENINWTPNIIKTYEPLLSKTYELQRNMGINWDEALIKEFLNSDWLDWSQLYFNRKLTISRKLFEAQKRKFITTKFLINETPDSLTFYYEHEYFTKDRTFKDYLRKSSEHPWSMPTIDNDNKDLKQYHDSKIADIPIEIFKSFEKEFNWHTVTQFADVNWSWDYFEVLYPNLTRGDISTNKAFYKKLFEPQLNSATLLQLTQEFARKKRFFTTGAGDDKYGTPPEIKVIAPSNEYYIRDIYNFSDSFPDSIDEFKYKITHTPEGPKRFLDVLCFENDYGFPGFACSEKIKLILEQFDLPNHAFYPISVSLESQWYGKDSAQYYLFITNNSSLLDNLKAESTELRNREDLMNSVNHSLPDSLRIRSKTQFQNYINNFHYEEYKNNELAQIELKKYFDLLTIRGKEISISERLKNALIEAEITGLKYSKNYSINWILEPPKSDLSEKISKLDFPDTNISYSQKSVKLYDEAHNRVKVLESNHDYVLNHYTDIEMSKLDSSELKLIELEIKWNVVVPPEYRKYLISSQKPKLGREFREYDFLPIDKLEQVGKEWHKTNVKLFRGLLIAENGLGDYLGLLLDENSNFELSNTIYKFEHEVGEIIKSIEIE